MSKESFSFEPEEELTFEERAIADGIPPVVIRYEQGPNARSKSHEIDKPSPEIADERPQPVTVEEQQ